MSTPARKRLVRDLKIIQKDPPYGISAFPNPKNILEWEALIIGPSDTPWEEGTFKLKLEFCEEYPNRPPSVRFVSKMYHPNIYSDGRICLDILQNKWSPIYDVSGILTSIQSLLSDPNADSPANCAASTLFRQNRRKYNAKVREIVEASLLVASSFSSAASMDKSNTTPKRRRVAEDAIYSPPVPHTMSADVQNIIPPLVMTPMPMAGRDEFKTSIEKNVSEVVLLPKSSSSSASALQNNRPTQSAAVTEVLVIDDDEVITINDNTKVQRRSGKRSSDEAVIIGD